MAKCFQVKDIDYTKHSIHIAIFIQYESILKESY